MMAGTYWTGGWDALPSQLVMVSGCTPICPATCFWKSLRSRRRVRI
jgi:hypothetical protein